MSEKTENRPPADSRDGAVAYRIDSDNLVTAVNEAWCAFADANQGEHLQPPEVIGKCLWDLLSDEASREIYATLLKRVRDGFGPLRFPLRCDAPEWMRQLTATIRMIDDAEVEFRFQPVSVRHRAAVPLLDVQRDRDSVYLTICGWCCKVPMTDGRWLEIEDACRELSILEEDSPPQLTHGICSACSEAMLALVS